MAQSGPLISIVDDNPEDRAAVRRHLAHDRAGYRFAESDTAADAVATCQVAAPACLLLDFELDDDDGLEILERITGGTGVAPCPVVMLTGRGNESIAVRAMKRGAMDYLVKGSYTPDGLRQTVSDAIAKFAARPDVERMRAERERANRAVRDASPGRDRLILIVDDSPEDRLAARRSLAKAGPSYRFLEEGTGAEGLALCRSAGLDCLLLDYSLPDFDGLEFLDELTGGTAVTPFPVVVLTGRGDEAVAVQALKRGAVDYLIKGRYTPEALRDTIEQAIDRLAERRLREEQRCRVLERLEREARTRADQLAEADRRKDEFLAMLAHELRNPLAPVANALHLLGQAGPLPEPAGSALEIARRQVRHLTRLVDDLMEVSRITRGKVELKVEAVDLNQLVARAAETVRPLVQSRRHELTVDLPAGPIPMRADPTRLEQILTNLMNNAAKYTDPGGRIAVSVARDGATAEVRVADTGVGIDAETLTRVFDLFAQADRSLDRAQGGLGIGLTLVRALAEQHGGSVEAFSDGVGSGSTFVVRLPVEVEEGAAAEPEARPQAAGGGSGLRVLVVDDNADGAEMLAMLFRASGHDVLVAHDGPSGLDMARRERPDVAFLDIGLPLLNGYEVARALRSEFGASSPTLVAFTGYAQAEDRRRTVEAGFDHHLAKPVDPAELIRVVSGVRDRRQAASPPA